jgi:beta-carotene hydroxylase
MLPRLETDRPGERVEEIRIADTWRGPHRGRFVTNPTVLAFFGAGLAGAANVAGYLAGRIPLAIALPVSLVVLYVLWYVMHEASHQLAHRRRRVNDVIGWVAAAPLFLAFTCFAERHQQHHAHTNDPRADPDIAVSRTPWPRRMLGLYFPATYRATCARGGKRASRSLRRQQIVQDVTVLAGLVVVLVVGGLGLLVLVIVPPLVIAPVITFTFSYLPHRPFRPVGRYRDTREQRGRLISVLLFGQNHHLTHHLWVNVPWFRLPLLAAEIEDQLAARGCGMEWR